MTKFVKDYEQKNGTKYYESTVKRWVDRYTESGTFPKKGRRAKSESAKQPQVQGAENGSVVAEKLQASSPPPSNMQDDFPIEVLHRAFRNPHNSPGLTNGHTIKMLPPIHVRLCNCSEQDAMLIYEHLYNVPEVMATICDGKTRSLEEAREKMRRWKRIMASTPYFIWMVFTPPLNPDLPSSTGNSDFAGVAVFESSDEEGSAEVSGLVRKDYQGKSYGTHVMAELMEHCKGLYKQGQNLPGGQEFNRVIATCRPDNSKSMRLLKSSGFSKYKEEMKYGGERYFYEFKMEEFLDRQDPP